MLFTSDWANCTSCSLISSVAASSEKYIAHVDEPSPSTQLSMVIIFSVSSTSRYIQSSSYILLKRIYRLINWLYQGLTAHQHQKGHIVPKRVSPLEKNVMVLQTKNCTVWEHSLSGQVWTKCLTRPDIQGPWHADTRFTTDHHCKVA